MIQKGIDFGKIGEKLGYTGSYFLFTTLLFFVLTFLHKIPASWTYFHIMAVVALLAIAGIALRRYLYGSSGEIF